MNRSNTAKNPQNSPECEDDGADPGWPIFGWFEGKKDIRADESGHGNDVHTFTWFLRTLRVTGLAQVTAENIVAIEERRERLPQRTAALAISRSENGLFSKFQYT